MVAVKDVTVRFGELVVLSDVSLSLLPGHKTALVGDNGVGKSTLLKVMAGLQKPIRGSVQLPDDETVAYVPQDYALIPDEPVMEHLKRRAGLLSLEALINKFESALSPPSSAIQPYVDALERYRTLGGYEFDANLERVLDEIGLPRSVRERDIGELSGGQQVKIGLASILLSRFSVLLLDEPTNNLDLGGLHSLERFVANSPASMLIVSHDRRFLDRTADAVAVIDEHTRELSYHGVSFAEYREYRAVQLAAQSRSYSDYLDTVNRLQETVRRTASTVSRGPGKRSDSDKLSADYRASRASNSAAGAKRRAQRALDRLPAMNQPAESWVLHLKLPTVERSGKQVVSLYKCEAAYPGFHLGPVSLTVSRTDRIAIVGPNGSGKTTLVKLITGRVKPGRGHIRLGERVQIGRMDQDQRLTLEHETVIQAFMRESGVSDESEARTLLAKFNLSADKVLRSAASLSPGERSRTELAILMAKGANLLVLDEPTNHLDLKAQEELEAALLAYDGTVIVVSHDREFLERIGITTVYAVNDGMVTEESIALLR